MGLGKFKSGKIVFTLAILCLILTSQWAMAKNDQIIVSIPTEGSRTDGAWSQAWYEAYEFLKENYPNIKVSFSDLAPYAETVSILESQAQMGADLIFLDSFWLEAVQKVAPKYKDTWFVMRNMPVDMFEKLPNNVVSYSTKDHHGGFLAGIAAGMMTKTNILGYVAGVDYPDIIRAGKGFEAGAKYVNPDTKLRVMYTGSWTDVQKGYEAAKALIESGADVLMHYADNCGKGVFKAAKENNVYMVGEARDQIDFAPNLTITSFLIPHYKIADYVVKKFIKGELKKEQKQFGIEEGWDVIAPLRNVPDEVKVKVNEVKRKILAGELEVPEITDPKALKRMK